MDSKQTEDDIPDGQRLNTTSKEMGAVEVYASTLQHSPNGRFVTVTGDGEYVIYTALAWRNKAFGSGTSFAWAGDSNTYAVVENKTKIKVFKNFKEKTVGGAGWGGTEKCGELAGGRRVWWSFVGRCWAWVCAVLGLGEWGDCEED